MAVVAASVTVELEAKTARYESDIRRAAAETRSAVENAERQIRRSASGIRDSLRSIAAGFVGLMGIRELGNMADTWTRFTNQLRVAGLEGARLTRVQEELFQVAQRGGTDLEALGQLYGRLSASQRELNLSGDGLIRIARSVAAAIRIQGGAASESRGAIIQLTQALGGEIVRAEEFNSINEGARPILQAVANEITRYGGSVAKLRRDVIEGKVASSEFAAALVRATEALEQQAARAPLTLAQSFQVLNNALVRYVGQTNEAYGVTARISEGIKLLADNIDTVATALATIAVLMAGRYVAGLVVAAASSVAFTATQIRAAIAIQAFAAGAMGGTVAAARFSVAMATAAVTARAMGTSLLAAFGGPVGLAIGAIALGLIYYGGRARDAGVSTEQFREAMANARLTLEQTYRRAGEAANSIQQVGNNAQRATGQMNEFAGAVGAAARQLAEMAAQAREAERGRLQAEVNNLQAVRDQMRPELNRYRRAYPRGLNHPSEHPSFQRYRQLEQRNTEIEQEIARLERRWRELDPRQTPLSQRDLTQDQIENAQGGVDAANEILRRQQDIAVLQREQTEEARRRVAILQNEIRAYQEYQRLRRGGVSPSEADAQRQAYLQRLNSATERGNAQRDARATPRFTSREQAIGVAIRELKAAGFNVAENYQALPFNPRAHRTGEAHGRYMADVNSRAGDDAADPESRARNDAAALAYQQRGFRILWNGRIYEPGGRGPGRAIPRGTNQHTTHLHIEAPASIVGREQGNSELAQGELETEIAQALVAEQERQLQVAREMGQLSQERRRALYDLAQTDAERDQLAREDLAAEQTAYEANLHQGVLTQELTEAEAEQLRLAHRAITALRMQALDREARVRFERDQARFAEEAQREGEAAFQNAADLAELERDAARTATQRREIELRLLDLQMQEQRYRLAGVIAAADRVRASETATAEEKRAAETERRIAQARLNVLERIEAGRREGVMRSTAGPGEEFRNSLTRTAEEIDEDFQRIAVSGLEALNDELLEVITNGKSLGEVFHGVANSIIADLARIAIQQLIIRPLANSLFGGAGGGGDIFGSALNAVGSIFGGRRASGGHVVPGRVYRVNEGAGGRVEGFQPSGSGKIIPLGRMNAPSMGGGTVVHQTFVLDARYGVTTPELLRHVNSVARQSAAQAGQTAFRASQAATPARIDRLNKLGT